MNSDQARMTIRATLESIAPEADFTRVDDEFDLTEQLDLDSMDYLNWMLEIYRQTGIDIPQRDYSRMLTVADATRYLVAKSSSA